MCAVSRCQLTEQAEMEMEQGFTTQSTQNRSFQRRSSQPISWLSTEKTKLNKTNLKNTEDLWSNCAVKDVIQNVVQNKQLDSIQH